jgi:hypothetical protein
MGKFIYFIAMIIFLDLMFFIFINPESYSLTSVIWTSISALSSGQGWGSIVAILLDNIVSRLLIIAGVAILAGVLLRFVGGSSTNTETYIWTIIASEFLISIGADFVVVFRMLANVKPPLTTIFALILFLPIIIIFVFLLLEWIRGKD